MEAGWVAQGWAEMISFDGEREVIRWPLRGFETDQSLANPGATWAAIIGMREAIELGGKARPEGEEMVVK